MYEVAALLAYEVHRFRACWPEVALTIQVDDFCLDVADKSARNLVVTTAAAARDLAETLETRLHLPLSKEKTVVAASSTEVAARLARALKQIGATAEEAPTRLGLQFALRPHKGRGLQKKRWAAFKVKVGRLKRIARVKKTGRKPGLMHRALAAACAGRPG